MPMIHKIENCGRSKNHINKIVPQVMYSCLQDDLRILFAELSPQTIPFISSLFAPFVLLMDLLHVVCFFLDRSLEPQSTFLGCTKEGCLRRMRLFWCRHPMEDSQ
jgi:hypothetical protein